MGVSESGGLVARTWQTEIQLTPLRVIATPGGDVLHAMKASSPGYVGFGEVYFSEIHQGATKGWKRHRRMTLNLVVPRGRVEFLICRSKPSGNEAPRYDLISLSRESYQRLTVPPGLWVAFHGCEPENLVVNIADLEHDPSEAEVLGLADGPIDLSGAWPGQSLK